MFSRKVRAREENCRAIREGRAVREVDRADGMTSIGGVRWGVEVERGCEGDGERYSGELALALEVLFLVDQSGAENADVGRRRETGVTGWIEYDIALDVFLWVIFVIMIERRYKRPGIAIQAHFIYFIQNRLIQCFVLTTYICMSISCSNQIRSTVVDSRRPVHVDLARRFGLTYVFCLIVSEMIRYKMGTWARYNLS